MPKKSKPKSTALVPVPEAQPSCRYSILPDAWIEQYRKSSADSEQVNLDAEIGLVDTQIAELTAELARLGSQTTDEGKPFDAREAEIGMNFIERGIYERDKHSKEAGFRRLRAAIACQEGQRKLREEIRELIGLRRRLVATQVSTIQIAEKFVPLKDARNLLKAFADVVQAEVHDAVILGMIEERFLKIIRDDDERR